MPSACIVGSVRPVSFHKQGKLAVNTCISPQCEQKKRAVCIPHFPTLTPDIFPVVGHAYDREPANAEGVSTTICSMPTNLATSLMRFSSFPHFFCWKASTRSDCREGVTPIAENLNNPHFRLPFLFRLFDLS